jgi:hypothetical protein
MDKLLAVNEELAVYYHDETTPAKKIDPYKYLNELLSIRSAKGLVSFLQQYPDELVAMREVTAFKAEDGSFKLGNYKATPFKTRRSKRGMLYGISEYQEDGAKPESKDGAGEQADDAAGQEEHKSFFDFGQTALMNAASEYNVDYFDALTDLEKYTHYGEALEEWKAAFPTSKTSWTKEDARRFYEASASRPKPDLRIVLFRELEIVMLRVSAILELAAISHGTVKVAGFKFEHVNGPMELCRTVFPDRFISDLLPIPQALYALDNLHTDFYSHAPTRLHLQDGGGVSFLAHTNDEELATRDAAGCIASFVLAEWSHYYNKTDALSFDINFGYRLYEQANNPVVTELCRIVSEGRAGMCPVCGRPFVVKRRPVDGVLNKRFCTNSCKVKGFTERRSEEEPQE